MGVGPKVFVAGHKGLVGSAIVDCLSRLHPEQVLLTADRKDVDLTNQEAVNGFFKQNKPDVVYLAAAKVGGIYANNQYPAEFIYQNLMIQTNIIQAAFETGVERLLFLGSSCIYPKACPQPILESYLLSSELEMTNRAYALAKIAGIEMCWSYNRQYGTKYLAVMPTNLYGINDNFHLENSHVIPALIRKMHEAKVQNAPFVEIWGSGKPMREFLYNEDMASACVYLMNLPQKRSDIQSQYEALFNKESAPVINIGCGEDLSILELAHLIKEITGFKGNLQFDSTKPDGTLKKCLDISRLKSLGWSPKTTLKEGLEKTYKAYIEKTNLNPLQGSSMCAMTDNA